MFGVSVIKLTLLTCNGRQQTDPYHQKYCVKHDHVFIFCQGCGNETELKQKEKVRKISISVHKGYDSFIFIV